SRIGVGGACPRYRSSARDVAAAKRPLLRIIDHVGSLACEFLWTAYIDQRFRGFRLSQCVGGERANFFIRAWRRVVRRAWERRALARHRAAFGFPLRAPAVQQPDVLQTEQLEYPQRVRGPPVVLVSVEHDGFR